MRFPPVMYEAAKLYPNLVTEWAAMAQKAMSPPARISSPAEASDYVVRLLAGNEQELLLVVVLDRRGVVIGHKIVSAGSDKFTIVDPAQILRFALTLSRAASGVLLAHNHPSGDPTPSAQDYDVTRRVAAAANTLNIALLDHLVVGSGGSFISLATQGAVPKHTPLEAGYTC